MKTNRPCILPSLAGDDVIIPPAWLSWLVRQPERSLSLKLAIEDGLHVKYTMLHPAVGEDLVHKETLKHAMNTHLDELPSELIDEIACAVDEYWGVDKDSYTSVSIDQTLQQVIARAANRILVGRELCTYQKTSSKRQGS